MSISDWSSDVCSSDLFLGFYSLFSMTKSNAALTGKGEQRCDREGAAVATQLHRDARLVGAGAAEEIASLDPVAYPNLQCGKMSDEGRPAGAVIDDHDAAIVPEIPRLSDAENGRA